MILKCNNNSESSARNIFHSAEKPAGDSLVKQISSTETEIQQKKIDTLQLQQPENIVDENKVGEAVKAIEQKIETSPVADKYKEQIRDALSALVEKRGKEFKAIGVDEEAQLKTVFDQTLKDLEGFNRQEGVKEIYETIEPFFRQKDNIKPLVNLISYRRKSGFWEKINGDMNKLGISNDQITKIQELLKIKVDGKVGPQTINAISEMLGLDINVKFGDKTVYFGQTQSEEEKEDNKGIASKEDPTQTDGKEEQAPVQAPASTTQPTQGVDQQPVSTNENKTAPTAVIQPEISKEEKEKILKNFSQIQAILNGIGVTVSIELYINAYISSGQKVPFESILGNFQILDQEIKKTPNDLREFIDAERNEIIAALGMFANGYEENGSQKIQGIIEKARIEHEAFAHLAEIEQAKTAIQEKTKEVSSRAQTYLDYAYLVNGRIKSSDKDKEGQEHKYDLDNYLTANAELVSSFEEFIKAKEKFIGKDNPSQRETALNRVLKEKNKVKIPSLVEDKSNHLGIGLKIEDFQLPDDRAEFEQMKEDAALKLLFSRRENYLATGDKKFESDFEKSQAILTMNNSVNAKYALDGAIQKDGEQIGQDAEKNALKDAAAKNIETIVSDFDKTERLRASDYEKCYYSSLAFQDDMEKYKKFGEGELGVLPNVQAAYLQIIQNYLEKNKTLVLDSITNNPQINDYRESVAYALAETQGSIAALGKLFEQIARGEEEPSEYFMQKVHESAREVLDNKNLQKLAGHPATGFIRKFKYLDFQGKDEFRGQINLAVNGIYQTMDKVTKYHQNASQLCTKVLGVEGSPSTLKTFCKQTGKELLIVTVAVAAAVVAGIAIGASGGLAGIGIAPGLLTIAGNFVITTATTSLAAAVATQYTRAILEGNTDYIGTGEQLKAWGHGAMYSAAGGIGGVILGRGAGIIASKLVQSSTGLSQKAAIFVAQKAEEMLARASNVGTKVEGGALSQIRHFVKEVVSETGEELTEDAMQKIGEGISPSHPELGFVFSLIPSATRSARGTFMEKTIGISPRPGITGEVSNEGVSLKYSDPSEVIDLLKSRNMPADVVAEFEKSGEINRNVGGVVIRINKTAEPTGLRQSLSMAQGVKMKNKYGITYNESTNTYEYKNGKYETKIIEFFKKQGALIEVGENGETVVVIGDQRIPLKALKNSSKAESRTEQETKSEAQDKSQKKSQEESPPPEEDIKDIFQDNILFPTARILSAQVELLNKLFTRAKDIGFARKLFGIEGELTQQKIRDGYIRLSQEFHPDRNNGSQQATIIFQLLGNAKITLEVAFKYGQINPVEEQIYQEVASQAENTEQHTGKTGTQTENPNAQTEESAPAGSQWTRETVRWINSQINKIKNLKLRQKLADVVGDIKDIAGDIKTATSEKLNQLIVRWDSIKEKISEINKGLKDRIDAKIKDIQKKLNETFQAEKEVQEFDDGDVVDVVDERGGRHKNWVIIGTDEKTGKFILREQLSNGKLGGLITASNEQLNEWNRNGSKRKIRTSDEIIREAFEKTSQFKLASELLRAGIFKIERTINIGMNMKFHIGPVFQYNNRYYCVVMVDEGDGKLLPRVMYKSTSQASWRSGRGYNPERQIYDKGEHPEAYTQETKVVPKIADYLEQVVFSGQYQLINYDIIKTHFDMSRDEVAETMGDYYIVSMMRDFDDILEPFKADGYQPGGLYGTNATEYFRKLHETFPAGFIPDFTKGPIGPRIEKPSIRLQGVTEYTERYRGQLKGTPIEWEMGYDSEGRVWIEGISILPKTVNTYGLNANILIAGLLVNKPLEYKGKYTVGLKPGKEKIDMGEDSHYDDITPLLDNLRPIIEFRNARGISRKKKQSNEHEKKSYG